MTRQETYLNIAMILTYNCHRINCYLSLIFSTNKIGHLWCKFYGGLIWKNFKNSTLVNVNLCILNVEVCLNLYYILLFKETIAISPFR